jgi:hypothetical protein
MSVEAWCGVIGLSLIPIGGLVAWMFTVARDLGMIAANTDYTSRRMDAVAEDNAYIKEKVDEHAAIMTNLRMDVTRLDFTVGNIQKTIPHQ